MTTPAAGTDDGVVVDVDVDVDVDGPLGSVDPQNATRQPSALIAVESSRTTPAICGTGLLVCWMTSRTKAFADPSAAVETKTAIAPSSDNAGLRTSTAIGVPWPAGSILTSVGRPLADAGAEHDERDRDRRRRGHSCADERAETPPRATRPAHVTARSRSTSC